MNSNNVDYVTHSTGCIFVLVQHIPYSRNRKFSIKYVLVILRCTVCTCHMLLHQCVILQELFNIEGDCEWLKFWWCATLWMATCNCGFGVASSAWSHLLHLSMQSQTLISMTLCFLPQTYIALEVNFVSVLYYPYTAHSRVGVHYSQHWWKFGQK